MKYQSHTNHNITWNVCSIFHTCTNLKGLGTSI